MNLYGLVLTAIGAMNGAIFYNGLKIDSYERRIARGTRLVMEINQELAEKGSSARVTYNAVTDKIVVQAPSK